MEGQLTLGYWGIRGLAQPIRFLLEYLGLPYTDKKYTSQEQWQTEKAVLLQTTPLANIPYLQDGENVVYESAALAIYLVHKANRLDLLGQTAEERVHLVQTRGVLNDLLRAFFGKLFGPKESFSTKDTLDAIRPFLVKLDYLLGGKPFVSGQNVRLVDFYIYESLDTLKNFDEETFNSFPNFVLTHNEFRALPAIEAYLNSDRFQARPFYPTPYANWG